MNQLLPGTGVLEVWQQDEPGLVQPLLLLQVAGGKVRCFTLAGGETGSGNEEDES
ncbi:MAG TPA: hypothetical protein PLB55_05185 [Prosthecobacter sp.]|nr:hypothetical protein [Prosthecobacter sp.]